MAKIRKDRRLPMPKYRVYELAKIFDKSAEEIIEVLQKHHIEVTNRLNSGDEDAKKISATVFAPKHKKTKRIWIHLFVTNC